MSGNVDEQPTTPDGGGVAGRSGVANRTTGVRLYSATPTRLMTWLDCQRRYRFSYLDRPAPPKGPPWAHNSVGASVHLALAGWWRLPIAARTPNAAGDLLERAWQQDGFRDADQSLEWRRRSRAMVERYVAGLDPADEPRGVERTVSVTYGRTALSGRVDRIDERPVELQPTAAERLDRQPVQDCDPDLASEPTQVELVVVDYKTGRHLLTLDDVRSSLAMAVYAAAAARTLRRRCVRVELHHLPSGEVISWDHSVESLERHLRRADAIAAECAEADERFRAGLSRAELDDFFPPNPSSLCAWCDFAAHCPEGRAGVVPKQPWDGLGEG